jgi:hypothetical protein
MARKAARGSRPPSGFATERAMIHNLVPASEADLYWEWMRAEVDQPPGSPRAAYRAAQAGLETRVLDHLARNDRTGLSEEDWVRIRRGFHGIRGTYLDPLLSPSTRWSNGTLPVAELGSVGIINATISFVPLAHSRRIDEFVAALEAGRKTPNLDFFEVYRSMRQVFDPARSRGCLVLIAERTEGPYVLAEGLTRACVLVSRLARQEPVPTSVKVLLGVSSEARTWPWF